MKFIQGLTIALSALLGLQLVWEFLVRINLHLSPSFPWFFVPAALAILTLSRLVADRHISVSVFGKPEMVPGQVVLLSAGIIGCMCLSLWLATIFPYWMVAAHRPDLYRTGLVTAFAVTGPVFAALAEELIFRGILQTAFLRVVAPLYAIGAVAILSTLAHWTNGEFGSQWPFYLTFSVFMGFVTFTTKSLLPSIVLHGSMNLIGNLTFLLIGPWNPATMPSQLQKLLLASILLCCFVFIIYAVRHRRSTP